MRRPGAALVFTTIAACGGAGQPPVHNAPHAAEVASDDDRSDESGSHFLCQGDGPSKEAARDAARAICNDKICILCGVEVESVVRTTETLDGVAMQRKVVERCNQVRQDALEEAEESSTCDANGCSLRLQIHLSKENEERECAAYRSGHFNDPALCERLIDDFGQTRGRDARSFQTRMDTLDQATAACAGIDTNLSPRLKQMFEQLDHGMARLLSDPNEEISAYLTYAPREESRKTLIGRLQGARGAMPAFKLIAEVLDATKADDLDTREGIARLSKALEAAPASSRSAKADVRLYALNRLTSLHEDLSSIIKFYRRAYPPEVARTLERSREDFDLSASARATNRECGSNVVATIDWDTFDDDALHTYGISGYCAPVLHALYSWCSSASGKAFAQGVRSLDCRLGAGELRMSKGQLFWSVNFDLNDLDSLARSALSTLTPSRQ
jgi:hypothetical protein